MEHTNVPLYEMFRSFCPYSFCRNILFLIHQRFAVHSKPLTSRSSEGCIRCSIFVTATLPIAEHPQRNIHSIRCCFRWPYWPCASNDISLFIDNSTVCLLMHCKSRISFRAHAMSPQHRIDSCRQVFASFAAIAANCSCSSRLQCIASDAAVRANICRN